jgi:uncharacterized membrane protein SpoIIM required for sporulation
MLDALLYSHGEETSKQHLFFYTSLYTTLFTGISIFLTNAFLPFQLNGIQLGGVMAVLLTTLALLYPLTSYLRSRDEEELQTQWSESSLIKRHIQEAEVYLTVFFAASLIFGIAYLLVPSSFFEVQSAALPALENTAQQTAAVTGNLVQTQGVFSEIFINNTGVFFITFLLSLLITGGMIFILIWNASVLGTQLGQLSSSIIEAPARLLAYVPHGVPEIGGYILAGLSGSLLAYHIEHYLFYETHDHESFSRTLIDSSTIFILGIGLIALGAGVETYLIGLG